MPPLSDTDQDESALSRDDWAERFRDVGCDALMAQKIAGVVVRAIEASPKPSRVSPADAAILFFGALKEMLRTIRDSEKPKYRARLYLLSLGAGDEKSGRELARQYGVSPEAISKEVAAAMEKYNLPRTDYNKSLEASASYRLSNRPNTRHAI